MTGRGIRQILQDHRDATGFLKRLAVPALVIALLLLLSTLAPDDGSRESSFDAGFFTGLIPWAVVIFAGAEGVRWLRRELRLARRRHEDRRR